jgi:hypothetical protein
VAPLPASLITKQVNKINIFEALSANGDGGMVTWPQGAATGDGGMMSPGTGATTGHGKNSEGAVDGLRQADSVASPYVIDLRALVSLITTSCRHCFRPQRPLAAALVLEDLGSVQVPTRRLATENRLNRIRDEEINKRVDPLVTRRRIFC